MKRRVIVSALVATFMLLNFVVSAMAASGEVLILHFDEGSGTIARDSSGNGNDGAISGATWVDGISGKALSFDGVNDYVEITPHSDVSAIGDFTISVWTYVVDWKGQTAYGNMDRQYVFDGTSHSKTATKDFYRPGFALIYDGNSYTEEIHNFIYYGDDRYLELRTPIVLKGKWIHHVFQRKGNMDYTYINGELLSANYVSGKNYKRNDPLNMQHNWFIGTFSGYNPYYSGGVIYGFYGNIDEVAIYSQALTAEEIKAQYLAKKAGLTPVPAITLTKSASPSTIQEGETTTISIRVENTGTGDAKNIEVKDTIPTGFKVISGSKDQKYDTLKANEYRTYQYTLQATGTGRFVLDPATATYSDESGNSYSSASNSVTITSEASSQPTTPKEEGKKGIPGFEAVCAIAGLAVVAHLVRRRKVIK